MKYALDTNLYIRAIREPAFGAELAGFLTRHAPRTFLSSVVLHEIVVGADTPAKLREVDDRIGRPFRRAGRLFTPSHQAWLNAAGAIARLAVDYGLDRGKLPRSFVNDVLIASSLGEAGVILITDNARDFERIRSVMRFEFREAWPSSAET